MQSPMSLRLVNVNLRFYVSHTGQTTSSMDDPSTRHHAGKCDARRLDTAVRIVRLGDRLGSVVVPTRLDSIRHLTRTWSHLTVSAKTCMSDFESHPGHQVTARGRCDCSGSCCRVGRATQLAGLFWPQAKGRGTRTGGWGRGEEPGPGPTKKRVSADPSSRQHSVCPPRSPPSAESTRSKPPSLVTEQQTMPLV